MVFVTVGTQKQSFRRLFLLLENSEELKNDTIIAQAGNTNFNSSKMNIYSFMEIDTLKKYISDSEFIVCHGGVGSIFDALLVGKKVLAVPRLSKYSEHINDHQLEICLELERLGYLKVYDESRPFDLVVKELRSTDLKKYETDYSFIEKLKAEI